MTRSIDRSSNQKTEEEEPRNRADEYRANVKHLQSKARVPQLVIRPEQGWGVVPGRSRKDALTKQDLPNQGPVVLYRLESGEAFDTSGKAEAVADLLIALPQMAIVLAEECDLLDAAMVQLQKRNTDLLFLLERYGIDPVTGDLIPVEEMLELAEKKEGWYTDESREIRANEINKERKELLARQKGGEPYFGEETPPQGDEP